MPLSHQERIARDANHLRIVDLWFALQPLKSAVAFMQSGAHPDDETSAMLAALSFREGFAVSYACAVRGEGGQNDIGSEVIKDLGVLRTAEMERAADVLDMNLYWLSEHPEDTIFDFGFSKDGKDTMARWGGKRLLKRFVEIVRTERPDVLCPTFLDIPGQHGHHRAMTEAAQQVFDAAADPAFPVNLPVWDVAKLYLPAWSGAGGSYDDEVPPPPATLTVEVTGEDPVTGWTWERIGQMSRAYHKTQGMGRWIGAGSECDRPLHLLASRISGPDQTLSYGLPELEDLGPGIAAALRGTIAAFPENAAVLRAATEAVRQVREAQERAAPAFRHRLLRKEAELSRVIRIAAEVEIFAHVSEEWLRPGELADLTVEARTGRAGAVEIAPILPDDWVQQDGRIGPAADAHASDPYPSIHRPLVPNGPTVSVRVTESGVTTTTLIPLLVPPVIFPQSSVELSVDRAVLNVETKRRSIELTVKGVDSKAGVSLVPPDGWSAENDGAKWRVVAPQDAAAGRYDIPVRIGSEAAQIARRIEYPHVAPRARVIAATVKVQVIHAELPKVRVGYIGGGNDQVGHWLAEMGFEVVTLPDAALGDPTNLAQFDSLVIGIFAMRFRDGLLPAMPAIHRWTEGGGTLLTLYHRPWDNWDPDKVPPRRIEIGQPSLRWRVTDECAAVTHLVPDHPLLTTPNRIDETDWLGWRKERGLYFAKSWDSKYVPILEMADPGEAAHRGALLAADIGKGRHIHCALILHHQMSELVPGAFRIMANLLSSRGL